MTLQNTVLNQPRTYKPEDEKEFDKHVKFDTRGVQNHLLIGHGITQDNVRRAPQVSYEVFLRGGVAGESAL